MRLIRHFFVYYGNTGCGVFKRRIQNSKGFWLKVNITKENHRILKIEVMVSCQKLDIFLENKVIQKMMILKNVCF